MMQVYSFLVTFKKNWTLVLRNEECDAPKIEIWQRILQESIGVWPEFIEF